MFTRVQVATTGADRNAVPIATHAATFGASPTEGNLLFATAMFGNDSTGPTGPTGWTLIQDYNVGVTARQVSWYKVAGAGESATVTVTTTNASRCALIVAEYSCNGTPSLDTSQSERGTSNTIYTGATNYPSRKNGLYLASGGWQQNSAGTSYNSYADTELHNLTLVDSAAHRNGSGDTQRVKQHLFEYIGADGYQDPCCANWYFTSSSTANPLGQAIIFVDDAEDAEDLTPISGAGTATRWDVRTTAGTLASTTISATFAPGAPPDGTWLVAAVGHRSATADTVTCTPPTGWSSLGEVNVTLDNGLNYDRLWLFWKRASGESSGTYQWTFNASIAPRVLIMAGYTGLTEEESYEAFFHNHYVAVKSLTSGTARFWSGDAYTTSPNGVGVLFVYSDSWSWSGLTNGFTQVAQAGPASSSVLTMAESLFTAGDLITCHYEGDSGGAPVMTRVIQGIVGAPFPTPPTGVVLHGEAVLGRAEHLRSPGLPYLIHTRMGSMEVLREQFGGRL